MKTFNDVQKQHGFFNQYSIEYYDNLIELFPDITSEQVETLDTILLRYGDKLLLKQYNNLYMSRGSEWFMKMLCHEINLICFEKWKKLQEQYSLEFNPQNPLKRTKTVEETKGISKDETTENKLFAYNSETASDKDTSILTGDNSETIERQETIEYSNGKLPNENAVSLIDFYTNNNYIESMCNDIVGYCTIDIY